MTRQEMLNQLHELPYPIIEEIVVFDDGCEFCVLTQREGFQCLVGGIFPIIGPIKLTKDKHDRLCGLFESKENVNFIHIEEEQESLWKIEHYLGKKALIEMFQESWPPNKAFYVFHDMGRGESAFFPTLLKAYEHFITYFTNIEDGTLWDSMTDDELHEWIKMVDSWRAKGAKKLPSREYLGAYYSPYNGSGRIVINEK